MPGVVKTNFGPSRKRTGFPGALVGVRRRFIRMSDTSGRLRTAHYARPYDPVIAHFGRLACEVLSESASALRRG